VALVRLAELDFHLVPTVRLRILQQQVQATDAGLDALSILQVKVAESQDRRVRGDLILKPLLVKLGRCLEKEYFRLA
jgi:hypothetical protein